MTRLDRLARSLRDARDIADDLTQPKVKLSLGGSVYDPTDAIGKLLFNVLATVADFEGDLIRMRNREGMAVAEAKGRLRGKQPKLTARQEAHLVELHRAGRHTSTELAELFGVARSTIYRPVTRAGSPTDAGGALTGSDRQPFRTRNPRVVKLYKVTAQRLERFPV